MPSLPCEITRVDRAALERVFDEELDKRGAGKLTVRDLLDVLSRMRRHRTAPQLRRLWRAIDVHDEGCVRREAFVQARTALAVPSFRLVVRPSPTRRVKWWCLV